jgi:Regulator of chromosome condensation (RCC1) repeat
MLTSSFLCAFIHHDDCHSVGSATDVPAANFTVDLEGRAVSDVGCGAGHTCVLLDKGTVDAKVKCFGANDKYQLVRISF